MKIIRVVIESDGETTEEHGQTITEVMKQELWYVAATIHQVVDTIGYLHKVPKRRLLCIKEEAPAFTVLWQPIETAPKDGTWVLLIGGICFDEDDRCIDSSRPVVGQWTCHLNGEDDPRYGRWQFAWYDGGYYGEYKGPTLWMPLPLQPSPPDQTQSAE